MDITANNAPDMLYEAVCRMRVAGMKSSSRNGPMEYIPEPVVLTVRDPHERVVFDPDRDANPFFHVAESIWMLGGGKGLKFLLPYNKRMADYSDDGHVLHGAYGHRWRQHFYRDQIKDTVELLKEEPETRRAIIGMFDAEVDKGNIKDIPCNTHICFRVHRDKLDMTVFNRSNDLVWGAVGANIVHMTVLHEVMAHAVGRSMGVYRVVTNCLHAYTTASQYSVLRGSHGPVDYYRTKGLGTCPVLSQDENYTDLLQRCERVVAMPNEPAYGMTWLDDVWVPMRNAYHLRKTGLDYQEELDRIAAPDWRTACQEWCTRRDKP